jgi:hypothetical protein
VVDQRTPWEINPRAARHSWRRRKRNPGHLFGIIAWIVKVLAKFACRNTPRIANISQKDTNPHAGFRPLFGGD